MSYLHSLQGKKIAVVGVGVTGEAVHKFLTSHSLEHDLFDEKSKNAQSDISTSYDLAIGFFMVGKDRDCSRPGVGCSYWN